MSEKKNSEESFKKPEVTQESPQKEKNPNTVTPISEIQESETPQNQSIDTTQVSNSESSYKKWKLIGVTALVIFICGWLGFIYIRLNRTVSETISTNPSVNSEDAFGSPEQEKISKENQEQDLAKQKEIERKIQELQMAAERARQREAIERQRIMEEQRKQELLILRAKQSCEASGNTWNGNSCQKK